MGKKLVTSKPLVTRGTKRGRPIGVRPKSERTERERMAEIRAHYTKPVRVQADFDAVFPSNVYYFQQIYSPDDIENPLKGTWDRANHLRSVGYDHGNPVLVKMRPQEFIDLCPEPYKPAMEEREAKIKSKLKSGDWEARSMISDGPFMDLGSMGIVVSHEGRHRAAVLRDLGYTEIPVLIYDRGKRNEDWRIHEPWMKPEVNRLSELKRREREKERTLRKRRMK